MRRGVRAAALLLLWAALPGASANDAKARSAEGQSTEGAARRGLIEAPFAAIRTGTVRESRLREISGMAISRRAAGLLWVHNDSGARAQVHALTPDGKERARVTIKGATANDWEDMASFVWRDQPMLLVADAGDNDAVRPAVWLHVIHEPELTALADEARLKHRVPIAWSVPFRFPDGPADCEAVAVDVDAGVVLILTKRENPPRLYSVPLAPEGALPGRGSVHDATLLAEVTTIPRPTASDLLADPVFGAYASQPTAMDVAGNELIIMTYRHAYLFEREPEQSWADAVAAVPRIVVMPRMKQPEAIAFDQAGRDVYVTSERRNAPFYRLARHVPEKTRPAANTDDAAGLR